MQTNLFEVIQDSEHCEKHALGAAIIREFPRAFSQEQAELLLQSLLESINWRQESLRIGGRIVPVPRLQCWMGDKNSRYGYSGMRLKPTPWTSDVQGIRDRVEQLASCTFNSVLLNLYRDGQDSVAWHADDESELGRDPVIASVSFGAERPFQLKPKTNANIGTRNESYKIILNHGSVLIMGPGLQANWQHQLPKVRGLQKPRINLTFRNIL